MTPVVLGDVTITTVLEIPRLSARDRRIGVGVRGVYVLCTNQVETASTGIALAAGRGALLQLLSIRLDRLRGRRQAVNPEVAGSSPVEPAK